MKFLLFSGLLSATFYYSAAADSLYSSEKPGIYIHGTEDECQKQVAQKFISDLFITLTMHTLDTSRESDASLSIIKTTWDEYVSTWSELTYFKKAGRSGNPHQNIIERNERVFSNITLKIIESAMNYYSDASTEPSVKTWSTYIINCCLCFFYVQTRAIMKQKLKTRRSSHHESLLIQFKNALCVAFNVTSMTNEDGLDITKLNMLELAEHLITRNPDFNFLSKQPVAHAIPTTDLD